MLAEGITMVLGGLIFVALGVWYLRYLDRTGQDVYKVWHPSGTLHITHERATKNAVVFLIFGVIALVLGIVTLLTQRLFGIFPY